MLDVSIAIKMSLCQTLETPNVGYYTVWCGVEVDRFIGLADKWAPMGRFINYYNLRQLR